MKRMVIAEIILAVLLLAANIMAFIQNGENVATAIGLTRLLVIVHIAALKWMRRGRSRECVD